MDLTTISCVIRTGATVHLAAFGGEAARVHLFQTWPATLQKYH